MSVSDGFTCPCCGSESLAPILRAPDSKGARCLIYHCTSCCALVPDYHAPEMATLHHQQSYHENYWSEEDNATTLREATEVEQIVQFYRKLLDGFDKDSRILDLGGGRGLITRALLAQGYNAFGCEPSSGLVQRGRSLLALPEERYIHADIDIFLESERAAENKASAVFLWHVIEHLQNPLDQLLKIRSILADDGILICQGPLLSPEYVFPEHRFLHSESNITWLARTLDMKVVMLDALSRERFISFVLARHDHPATALSTVFISDTKDATGSLYFSLCRALELTRTRRE